MKTYGRVNFPNFLYSQCVLLTPYFICSLKRSLTSQFANRIIFLAWLSQFPCEIYVTSVQLSSYWARDETAYFPTIRFGCCLSFPAG